ncbi:MULTISPECIES: ATP-dependent DNA ligase [unclassified Sporolactobacillus]|uniref:ATP-dependent DNA ligase n=1 Tax=unclassified Sporolactobacillus TaxID=2628533 RepID=UPI002FBEC4A8
MRKLNPVIPFEPVPAKTIPDRAEWIHQIKWDGVRVLCYFGGREIRLFNRKKNERTAVFPELQAVTKCTAAESFILDGEVIALDQNGRPSFHDVMRRDGIRQPDRIKAAMKNIPIYYMIFDLIYCNGQWLNDRPLQERLDRLAAIVTPSERIQLTPVHRDGPALFHTVKKMGLEGIVSKDSGSRYMIGGQNADWRKIKNYKDLIAVIGGVAYHSDIVRSVLLGLYDEQGRLIYIGRCGTGNLTMAEWQAFTQFIVPLITDTMPFAGRPPGSKGVRWLEPRITVRVKYINWAGHALRQPSIQAFVGRDPEKCRIKDDHHENFR